MAGLLGYDDNNKYHRFARKVAIAAISLSVFVIIWWFLSLISGTAAVPTPWETFQELGMLLREGDTMTGRTIQQYAGSSLQTFFKGFLVALALAAPLGLLLGYSRFGREFATPVIELLRPIAPIAWAPIFILSIGYTTGPIMVVAIGVFFPLLTNTVFGVMKIEPVLIDAAKTLGASQMKIFYKVMVPCALPYVMNGIKIGLGVGWMCIVAAELYAPSLGGIGRFLATQAELGFWPGAYSALIVIAFLGIITTGLADYAHKIITERMGME